jgi:hypothetical protein
MGGCHLKSARLAFVLLVSVVCRQADAYNPLQIRSQYFEMPSEPAGTLASALLVCLLVCLLRLPTHLAGSTHLTICVCVCSATALARRVTSNDRDASVLRGLLLPGLQIVPFELFNAIEYNR